MNERDNEDASALGRNAGSFMGGCASGVFAPLGCVVFVISALIYIFSKAGIKKQVAFWFMLGAAAALGLGFALIRNGFMNF